MRGYSNWKKYYFKLILGFLRQKLSSRYISISLLTNVVQCIQDLKQYARQNLAELSEEDIVSVLRERLIQALQPPPGTTQAMRFAPIEDSTPTVVFIIGANGKFNS